MRARDKFKYGAVGAGAVAVAAAVLLTTGWAQAAATTATQVFVTNKGAAQAVPVQQQGSVGTISTVAAANALNLTQNAGNRSGGSQPPELIHPTQASISLTSLTVVVGKINNFDPWAVYLAISAVPNGTTSGNCVTAATVTTQVQLFDLFPGTTATLSPASPLLFAPPPGQTRCMWIGTYNDGGTSSNNTGLATVSATGYVVSGTYNYPHGTN